MSADDPAPETPDSEGAGRPSSPDRGSDPLAQRSVSTDPARGRRYPDDWPPGRHGGAYDHQAGAACDQHGGDHVLVAEGVGGIHLRAENVDAFIGHVAEANDAAKCYRSESELEGRVVRSCRVSEIQPDDVEKSDPQETQEDEPVLENEGSGGVPAHELDRLLVDRRQAE